MPPLPPLPPQPAATGAAEAATVERRPPPDEPAAKRTPAAAHAGHELTLEQLRDAWTRSVLPALRERSIPTATLLEDATPVSASTDDTLTLAFAAGAEFHRSRLDDPKTLALVRDALSR